MTEDILSFSGEHRWLSNFWPAPVVLDGVTYPSVEFAYVAAKSSNPEDRARVLECRTPGEAKRTGRTLHLRKDWEDVKIAVMRELLRQKFTDPALRLRLVRTGTAKIIEGNTWGDRFWGVCGGRGENHLGRLLMSLRAQLQTEVGDLV